MLIPAAAFLALSAAPAIGKMIVGANQRKQANQYAKTDRPTLDIPDYMLDAMEFLETRPSLDGLPGEEKYLANIEESTATGFENVKSISSSQNDLLAAAMNMSANEMAQKRKLGEVGAEYAYKDRIRQENQKLDMNELLSNLELKAWEWNEQMPYLDAMNAASQLREAGNQNIYSGASDLAGGFGALGSSPELINLLNSYQKSSPSSNRGYVPNMPYRDNISSGLDVMDFEERALALPK